MRVIGAAAMREVDRRAIEEVGIPSMVLMENAAIGLAEAVEDLAASDRDEGGGTVDTVAILCGPGNNGGDGLALARHLDERGYGVRVFLFTLGRELSGDPAAQREILRHHERVELIEVAEDDDLDEVLAVCGEADLAVDALFGTGLGRPLEGPMAELVEGLNELPVRVLAVDLPSGLNGSRTDVFGPRVEADLTVTLAAPKPATVFPPAADAVGDLVVADLGLPPKLLEDVPEDPDHPERRDRLTLLTADAMARRLPARDADGHKGTYGHVVVAAGSPGKSGAALLAARAAVRAGAGLVTAAVPEAIRDVVDGGSHESMTLALDGWDDPALTDFLDGKDVLALGPGVGDDDDTARAVRGLALACPLPLVLDADGLNAFAGRAEELAERPAPTVLTPHPGELGRLLGCDTTEVQDDRRAAVVRAAEITRAVVVLKGHRTLVAVPAARLEESEDDGAEEIQGVDVSLALTGNSGMASGGSGDVLTGMTAALLGQLLPGDDAPAAVRWRAAYRAACLAVHLHGLAGDLAVEELGEHALRAGDLIETLPRAFRALERHHEDDPR